MDIQREEDDFNTWFNKQTINAVPDADLSLQRLWASLAWQAAKAEAVPEGFGDIQSWITVNSFSALDASMDDFPVVDANELAKYIDSLNEAQQPSSTSGCPDEP